MFVDMIIFMILAYRYKSIPTAKLETTEEVQSSEDELEGKREGLDNVAFKKE